MNFELPYTAKAGLRKDPAIPNWIDLNKLGKGVPLSEMDEYIEEYENGKFYQNFMKKYFGMVKCIDYNVGKLLGYLRDAGLEEDTIVV